MCDDPNALYLICGKVCEDYKTMQTAILADVTNNSDSSCSPKVSPCSLFLGFHFYNDGKKNIRNQLVKSWNSQ